jgi:hypothetical protein
MDANGGRVIGIRRPGEKERILARSEDEQLRDLAAQGLIGLRLDRLGQRRSEKRGDGCRQDAERVARHESP